MDRRITITSGVVALAYAALSLTWSPIDPAWGTASLSTIGCAWLFGYYFETRGIWFGLLLIAITALPVFSLMWDLYQYHGTNFGDVFILNPNYTSAFAVFGIAVAISLDWWIFTPVLAIVLLLDNTRVGLFLGAICFMFGLGRKGWTATAWCLALLALAAIAGHEIGRDPDQSRLWEFMQRLGVWQDTINHLSPWGHGFGSFFANYITWSPHKNITLYLPPHAYSDYLESVSDLGIGAIPLWIYYAGLLSTNTYFWHDFSRGKLPPLKVWRFDKLPVVVYIALSLVYWPMWIPPLPHLFALWAGHMLRPQEELAYA